MHVETIQKDPGRMNTDPLPMNVSWQGVSYTYFGERVRGVVVELPGRLP